VIRQAISCDICGTEKKLTNHWFVASDQGGELRVSGWNTRNRLRPGTKHLCGQTCLHKLVDEFMARAISARPQATVADESDLDEPLAATNASLTSAAAYAEPKPGVRPQATPAVPIRTELKPKVELVLPARPHVEEAERSEEAPVFMSRQWRAAAWEREREREMRSSERHTDIALRRRSS
jgi:hypothetical protein